MMVDEIYIAEIRSLMGKGWDMTALMAKVGRY